MTEPTYPRYFVSNITGALLRRNPSDEVFSHADGGTWNPTDKIGLYMIGDDGGEVDEITEEQARDLEPLAFS